MVLVMTCAPTRGDGVTRFVRVARAVPSPFGCFRRSRGKRCESAVKAQSRGDSACCVALQY
eukprot:729404-Pelagomonas_calceolata.AAC.2